MKWSRGAQWACFGVAVAWGADLAFTFAAGLGVGPWPSLERIVLAIAATGSITLIQHRREAPLVNAFRFGVSITERRRRLTAVPEPADDIVAAAVDEVVVGGTVHSLHQIR